MSGDAQRLADFAALLAWLVNPSVELDALAELSAVCGRVESSLGHDARPRGSALEGDPSGREGSQP